MGDDRFFRVAGDKKAGFQKDSLPFLDIVFQPAEWIEKRRDVYGIIGVLLDAD